MESNVQNQTPVDPQAVAERLTQLEIVYPGVIDRLVTLAAREELRECIEPIVDKVPEQRAGTVDPNEIPFGQGAEERAAYVQRKLMEALGTYRPSYQRKMLERCIDELPPDVDDAGGEDEPGADQPTTVRQKREATLKGPFIEQIAQWFRGLSTSEKLAAFMLQTCLSADQSSNGDIPVGLNELANVIIGEYSDTFEQAACHLFEPSPGQSIEGLGAVAFVIEQMQR